MIKFYNATWGASLHNFATGESIILHKLILQSPKKPLIRKRNYEMQTII